MNTFSKMCQALGFNLPVPLSSSGPSDGDLMMLMALWDIFCDLKVTVVFPDEGRARAQHDQVQKYYDKLCAGGVMSPPPLGVRYVPSITLPFTADGSEPSSFPGITMWTPKRGVSGRVYVSPDISGSRLSGPYRFAHHVVQAEGAKDVVEPDGTLLIRVPSDEAVGMFSGHFVRLLEE